MSTLDRAFLKAHAKTTPAEQGPARPHLPWRAQPDPVPQPPAAEATREGPQAGQHINVHIAAPPPAIPQPHLAEVAPQAPALVPAELAAPEVLGPLRAVFEIQKLSWPVLCQALVRAAEEELSVLADALAEAARRGEKRILVTGRRRGEGRTTVVICLARMLATRGLAVGLVDADFGQPHLARRLKLLPQTGWETPLAGETRLEEALIEAVDDKIVVLPLRATLDARRVAECRAAIDATLERLAGAMDIVLVDGGPVDDAHPASRHLIQACAFDGALVVRDARHSPVEEAADLARRLGASGIARTEIIENFLAP
jgi:Mrp family chromosome partitioning ATPase